MNVTVIWAGAADAGAGSLYRVRRTYDFSTWTELAASQAATSPYAATPGVLAAQASYGDTTVTLENATAWGTAGRALLQGAQFSWAGKSGNDLTGVTWQSGYGAWLPGTGVYVAHEEYEDSGVSPTNGAVVYEITHTNPAGMVSAPAYSWHYVPPAPASADHCAVIVGCFEDLGYAPREGVTVTVEISADTSFESAGAQVDAATAQTRVGTTNALGLAVFQCWRTSALRGVGPLPIYRFKIDETTFDVPFIPNQNAVLLSELIT